MTPKNRLCLDVLRICGLLARAALEDDTQAFLREIYALRKLCDVAIERLTFRIVDPGVGVDDDDL